MCGIVAYIGRSNALPVLMDGLRRLEYRGYDSAGVAIFEGGQIHLRKSVGRIANLAEEIEKNPAIKNYADAIAMTEKELLKILEKNQVKRIYPLNQKFDHNFHEAIVHLESEAEEGVVVQVIQSGYSIADRLIRPALVGVAKAKE